MKPTDILYENGDFWVSRNQQFGKGFEVYRVNGTHSVRVAIIGFEGQPGLERAKAEADRRAFAHPSHHQQTEAK
jgi:hypothetical protein